MKRVMISAVFSGLLLGIASVSLALPPPQPHPPPWRVPPQPHPPWRVPPPVWRVPPPYWRPPVRPWLPRPGVLPPAWAWRRPPLSWHYAPPPPPLHNWWFWVWWEPLPIDVVYYPAPSIDYSVPYNPYAYYSPEMLEYPGYNEEYKEQNQTPQIKSQKDYEQWLIQSLNLTDTQQKKFLPKLQELALLREKFVESSTALGTEIQNLQKADPSSVELAAKQETLQKTELEFRKKEQKVMNQLMIILTPEQRDTFINQMSQYAPNQAYDEGNQAE